MNKFFTFLAMAGAMVAGAGQAGAQGIPDPFMNHIPGPVAGNTAYSSQFVFPDAIDLNVILQDDRVPANKLMWTYAEPAKPGQHGYYLLNGVPPIDPAQTNMTSPTTSQIINWTVKSPEMNPDGKANTVTIRNQYLSPLGSTSAASGGWANGIIPAETTPVTLYCTNGTYVTSQTVYFYSSNNEDSRLSPSLWKTVKSEAPRPNVGWKAESWTPGVTSSTWAGTKSGLCIIDPITGQNVAEFASPAPYFQLSANTLYRIRLQMNSTQATPGKTPLWDLVVENSSPSGFGMMAYMQDTMFYDNPFNGGQNTVINTQNGDWKTIYWTPAAVSTPQWAKIFTSAYDKVNDPRLRFRIMDGGVADIFAKRSGAICIQNIVVESIPIGRVKVLSTPYNIAAGQVKQTTTEKPGNVEVQSLTSHPEKLKVTYANGTVTVVPTATVVTNSYTNDKGQLVSSSGQDYELAEIRPATFEDGLMDSDDNWPLTWSAPTTSDPNIYRMQVGLSAPSTTDEQHPWDAIILGMYTRTYELTSEAYITSRDRLGSPAYIVGADGTTIKPQTYTMFFQAGKGTKAPAVNAKLRWGVRFANVPNVAFPSSNPSVDKANTGAVTLHSVKIDKVDFSN